MKRVLAGVALMLGTAALSGCYYEPDYSYVRGNGSQGSAYYGEGPAVIYQPDYYGYYGPGWGYDGCCYSSGVSVGVSGTWYDGGHYDRGRDHDWRERHVDRDRHVREPRRDRDWRSRNGHDPRRDRDWRSRNGHDPRRDRDWRSRNGHDPRRDRDWRSRNGHGPRRDD